MLVVNLISEAFSGKAFFVMEKAIQIGQYSIETFSNLNLANQNLIIK